MCGVNATVVGLLGAALYNPVWASAVKAPGDFGIALVGFVLLTVWRSPPLLIVVISAMGGMALMALAWSSEAPMAGSIQRYSATSLPNSMYCKSVLVLVLFHLHAAFFRGVPH